jgi:hypothetical protein
MLLSTTNFLAFCDKLGWTWNRLKPLVGLTANQAAPVAGTVQAASLALQNLVVGLNDWEQETDFISGVNIALGNANIERVAKYVVVNPTQDLDSHFTARGSEVDSSITDTSSYLSYYNGGGGGSLFSVLVDPGFAALYAAIVGTNLPVAGVMSPAIHPVVDSTVSAYAMGQKNTAGTFNAGTAVNTGLYSAVNPIVEVVTDFSGGSAPPAVTIAGTDNTGVTSTTWSVTLTGNNPAAAVATAVLAAPPFSATTLYEAGDIVSASMTLNGAIDNSVTTITAASSSTGVPATPFAIQIDTEQLWVSAISGTSWTVTRGYNGTTAASHNDKSVVTVVAAATNLNGSITSGATTIVVNNAAVFPSPNYVLVIGSEQMLVTAASGNSLTVTRAYNSTTGAAHANLALVSLGNLNLNYQSTIEQLNTAPTGATWSLLSGPIVGQKRQTVLVGSTTGIVAGTVLTVDAGLPTQEVIIVEAVGTGTITAVFQLAHTAGATLTGNQSYATTPSVSGRRLVSVSGITLTLSSHSAGAVRVCGRQDRVAV